MLHENPHASRRAAKSRQQHESREDGAGDKDGSPPRGGGGILDDADRVEGQRQAEAEQLLQHAQRVTIVLKMKPAAKAINRLVKGFSSI